jgi:hypothetical protein
LEKLILTSNRISIAHCGSQQGFTYYEQIVSAVSPYDHWEIVEYFSISMGAFSAQEVIKRDLFAEADLNPK